MVGGKKAASITSDFSLCANMPKSYTSWPGSSSSQYLHITALQSIPFSFYDSIK